MKRIKWIGFEDDFSHHYSKIIDLIYQRYRFENVDTNSDLFIHTGNFNTFLFSQQPHTAADS